MKNGGKIDLRIQRTQKAIIDAFYELLDEKSFGAITVIDICERALINRGTFYTHFEDKYSLLDKCISDIMYGLHEQVKRAHGDSDLITYYNEVMDLGISFLAANRRRIRTIIVKADSALVFDRVHSILTHNIVNRLSRDPVRYHRRVLRRRDNLPHQMVAARRTELFPRGYQKTTQRHRRHGPLRILRLK